MINIILNSFMHRTTGASDPSIKPNLQEKERLDAIISSPRDNNLKGSEMDLMYKFRYSLTENRHALTKFLLCLDWTSQSEVSELPSLLALWKVTNETLGYLSLLLIERCYKMEYQILHVYK
jgi:hypothetical protein